MKNTLTKLQFWGLLISLLLFPQIILSQANFAIERAHKMTSYITEKMLLNEDQSAHLNSALVTKIKFQQTKVKGENLTDKEKKVVYTQSNKSFYSMLNRRFSKDDVTTIQKYMAEFNEKFNKKKKS
ncbi:MAG: hypothetical protein JEZ14_15230 [Marinilabiliaceae bacterium]|nr:hypothetical protein [Marinilabiliaceae bacterium]